MTAVLQGHSATIASLSPLLPVLTPVVLTPVPMAPKRPCQDWEQLGVPAPPQRPISGMSSP